MIIAERAARVEAEAVAARAQAVNTSTEVLIAHLKLEIEKLRRALYGSRSERKARLLEQMELQLEDRKTWRRRRPRMSWRPRKQRHGRRRSNRLSASGLPANHSPTICRASASSSWRQKAVPAAGR